MSCGTGRRRGSDLVLLWLWRKPAATALIWPLVWEAPYASGAALKKKKIQCCHCYGTGSIPGPRTSAGLRCSWKKKTDPFVRAARGLIQEEVEVWSLQWCKSTNDCLLPRAASKQGRVNPLQPHSSSCGAWTSSSSSITWEALGNAEPTNYCLWNG